MESPAKIGDKLFREFNITHQQSFEWEGSTWNSVKEAYDTAFQYDENEEDLDYDQYIIHCILNIDALNRKDFNKIKLMYDIILNQLTGNKKLRDLLLNTGDKKITFPECDNFWGGKNNNLGEIYEDIRNNLKFMILHNMFF